MPLYQVKCLNNHEKDVVSSVAGYGANPETVCLQCEHCGHTMGRVMVASAGNPVRMFSEKHPQMIRNMTHHPVEVRSMWEYDKKCKHYEVIPR